MAAQYIPRYTYNDYKNWKEDWELINGYPYSLMPSGKINHNTVQVNAIFQSKSAILASNCNCFVFSELDWKVNEDTVVRPNVMIVCGEPKTEFLEFPPILILEVLSTSTRKKDRSLKFDLYEEQGVKYYLMADYDAKKVEVYELVNNSYREVQKSRFPLDGSCEVTFEYDKWWS
jgi:Uma2 family endonuclease